MKKNNGFNSLYPCPYEVNAPIYKNKDMDTDIYKTYPYPYWKNTEQNNLNFLKMYTETTDYGPNPFVIDIEEATTKNNYFRKTLWTGDNLQLTLMSIGIGEDIGLEVHPDVDQFIRIEEGQGLTMIGDKKDELNFQKEVYDDFVIVIPANKWHNLINTGDKPLKLYSIYAPPEHPHGTIHETKADEERDEMNNNNH